MAGTYPRNRPLSSSEGIGVNSFVGPTPQNRETYPVLLEIGLAANADDGVDFFDGCGREGDGQEAVFGEFVGQGLAGE